MFRPSRARPGCGGPGLVRRSQACALAALAASCSPGNEPELERAVSAATTGRLQGVVYVEGDTSNRLTNATVTLTPGARRQAVRTTDAYWFYNVAPGDYTVTAEAPGYARASVLRTVAAGDDAWGSIGLRPAQAPTTGRVRGNVYDARQADMGARISGARVRASTGAEATSGPTGAFELELPPGPATITASKPGWVDGRVERVVVAGQEVWGSIGLLAEMMTPTNAPPQQPVLVSPVQGAEVAGPRPVFAVGELADPDGDALELELEVFVDQALTMRASRGRIAVPARTRAVAFEHGADDLPRGVVLFWRVRAHDATAVSPWTEPEAFLTPPGAPPSEPADKVWTGTLRGGHVDDAPPSPPEITAPAADAIVEVTQPRITVTRPVDPEGDPVRVLIEIAPDDVFRQTEAESGLLTDLAWSPPRELARGSLFYIRVRGADDRLLGPWGPARAFSVAADARTIGGGSGGSTFDRVGAPTGSATLSPGGAGCSTSAGSPGLAASIVLGAWWRQRRSPRGSRPAASRP